MISARSIGARARCEDYEAVDLASLTRKRGDLKPWSACVITFNSGLRIAAHPEPWAVTLKVEGVSHRIPLAYTATRFGGRRPWFLCPSCQTHRRLVYFSGRGFACRGCLDLRYSSQVEDEFSRQIRKHNRVRDCLGSERKAPFPTKPKHMQGKRYRALEAADRACTAKLVAAASALLPG